MNFAIQALNIRKKKILFIVVGSFKKRKRKTRPRRLSYSQISRYTYTRVSTPDDYDNYPFGPIRHQMKFPSISLIDLRI